MKTYRITGSTLVGSHITVIRTGCAEAKCVANMLSECGYEVKLSECEVPKIALSKIAINLMLARLILDGADIESFIAETQDVSAR
jgi:hypothetical protein